MHNLPPLPRHLLTSTLGLIALFAGCFYLNLAGSHQAEATPVQQAGAFRVYLPLVARHPRGPTQVYVWPDSSNLQPGQTVVLDVRIDNIVDLYGLDIYLRFDPTILEVVDAEPSASGIQVAPGTFPDPASGFVFMNTANNTTGEIRYVLTLLHPSPGATGSGVAAQVTFHARALGSSGVTFADLGLVNRSGEPVSALRTGATVTVAFPPTATPTVTQSPTPTATVPPSATPTPTVTPTSTPSLTPSPTETLPTATSTLTPMPTWTSTATSSPTITPTPSQSPTPTATTTPGPTATPTVTPTPTVVGACRELVTNGGFETDVAWEFGNTPARGQYTSAMFHSGSRSVRLGIQPPTPDTFSFSSVRQRVDIPATTNTVRLSFWFWPANEGVSEDLHEAWIMDTNLRPLRNIFKGLYDDRSWIPVPDFDLTEFRGQTIVLYFNVYNENLDTRFRSWMFVDDVSVQACP